MPKEKLTFVGQFGATDIAFRWGRGDGALYWIGAQQVTGRPMLSNLAFNSYMLSGKH